MASCRLVNHRCHLPSLQLKCARSLGKQDDATAVCIVRSAASADMTYSSSSQAVVTCIALV